MTSAAFPGSPGREYTFDPASCPVTPGAILCSPHGPQPIPTAQRAGQLDADGAQRAAAAAAWLNLVVKGEPA